MMLLWEKTTEKSVLWKSASALVGAGVGRVTRVLLVRLNLIGKIMDARITHNCMLGSRGYSPSA